MKSYDAVVIGSGPNGLVAATRLARAGLSVLVLERREIIGGGMTTEEFAPGFHGDVCAHDAGWLAPPIVRELELERHGLALLPDARTTTSLLPDGGVLTLFGDQQRTAEEIRRHSPRDAGRWTPFTTRLAVLAGFLERVYRSPAPEPFSTRLPDLFALLGLGRRLRGLGKREMIALLRTVPMSVAELVEDWFETDALRGLIAASGITRIMQGPRSGGTAFVLLHHHVGRPAGAVHAPDVVRGGVGRLTAALAAAARAAGVELRTGAAVARITVAPNGATGHATGVTLSNGDEIAARRVVSSADPRATLLGLVDPAVLDPEFIRAVRNVRLRGASAKVNLALAALPALPALPGGGEELLRGALRIAPGIDYLERAYDDAKHGRISARPYLEARIPSLHDPSLAPAGRHVMSVHVQFAPYALEGGWSDGRRQALGDAVVARLAEAMPGLDRTVLHRQVLTPADIEERYAVTEGSPTHGELTLDQILFMRPVPGWSRYRTPVADLYLCGAGTHPGSGITGLSGELAAREILRDAKRS